MPDFSRRKYSSSFLSLEVSYERNCVCFIVQIAALQPRTVLFTLQHFVSKAHCASQSTAKLISHTLSVKLIPHRLKPTKSVNNKKEKNQLYFDCK